MDINLADPPFNRAVTVYLDSKSRASRVVCVFKYEAGSVHPSSAEVDFDDEIKEIMDWMINPAWSIVLDSETIYVIGADVSALANQRFDVIRKRLVERGLDASRIRTRMV